MHISFHDFDVFCTHIIVLSVSSRTVYKLWFCLNFCQIKIKIHLNHSHHYRHVLTDSYSLSGKYQHNIIIREQLLYCNHCHLLYTIVTINLVSLSHTYSMHIISVHINIPVILWRIFYENLVSLSHMYTCHIGTYQ